MDEKGKPYTPDVDGALVRQAELEIEAGDITGAAAAISIVDEKDLKDSAPARDDLSGRLSYEKGAVEQSQNNAAQAASRLEYDDTDGHTSAEESFSVSGPSGKSSAVNESWT